MLTDASPLPDRIKVGVYDFALVRWGHLEGHENKRYGETSFTKMEIRVDFESNLPIKCAETLIHEILHAVHWVWNIDDKDDEERTVTSMSLGLATVWRDNHVLFGWIAEHLK